MGGGRVRRLRADDLRQLRLTGVLPGRVPSQVRHDALGQGAQLDVRAHRRAAEQLERLLDGHADACGGDARRLVDHGAVRVRGTDLAGAVDAVENRLDALRFPVEYYPSVLGESAEREAAEERMLNFALAVLVGVLLLLQAAFRSWRLALVFLLALPVALAGGMVGAMLDGAVLSLGSLMGFLGILTIAVRQGVMLIRHYQDLEDRDGEAFGASLVLRGTDNDSLDAATQEVVEMVKRHGDMPRALSIRSKGKNADNFG